MLGEPENLSVNPHEPDPPCVMSRFRISIRGVEITRRGAPDRAAAGADSLGVFLDRMAREAEDSGALGEEVVRMPQPCPGSVLMTTSVHTEILTELTSREPEAGGALLGPRNHPIVTHFVFDEGALVSPTSYTPDHVTLNSLLPRYREVGLEMKGLVHSHPSGAATPSTGDVSYIRLALSNPKNRVERYLLPIVCDGRMKPYVFTRESLFEGDGRGGRTPWVPSARLVLV